MFSPLTEFTQMTLLVIIMLGDFNARLCSRSMDDQ